MPPAAISSPEGDKAHEFTHVVGNTTVSILLSRPASQTTLNSQYRNISKCGDIPLRLLSSLKRFFVNWCPTRNTGLCLDASSSPGRVCSWRGASGLLSRFFLCICGRRNVQYLWEPVPRVPPAMNSSISASFSRSCRSRWSKSRTSRWSWAICSSSARSLSRDILSKDDRLRLALVRKNR